MKEVRVYYDEVFDLLTVVIGEPQPAITDEVSDRVHFRFDPETNDLVGIVIGSFQKFLVEIIGGRSI